MDEQGTTSDTLISGDELDDSVIINNSEEHGDDEPVSEPTVEANSLDHHLETGPNCDETTAAATQEPLTNDIDHQTQQHDDSLDQDPSVEIVTVMPHERDVQHDESLESEPPPPSLEPEPPNNPPAVVPLEEEMGELSLSRDEPEIEEVECFPPCSSNAALHEQQIKHDENEGAMDGNDDEMELDDGPIVETVHFTGASSADTILSDEDLRAESDQMEDELEEDVVEDDIDLPATSLSANTDANTILDTDSSKDGVPEASDVAGASASSSTNATTVPEPSSDLFKDVKFAVCEDIADLDKIKKVLVASGAKFLNYLSDSATHLIADNPEHSNVSEAVDIYEKPVVTSQWVWLSLRSNKVLPNAPFSPFGDGLFAKVVACPSQLKVADRQSVWAMITYYGGRFQTRFDATCTHLVTCNISGAKYEQASSAATVQKKQCKIVTPDWIVDSIRAKALCEEDRYHPKLLITYNVGKKVPERPNKLVKKDSNNNSDQKSVKDAFADDTATKTTKSVTMAISTEAVIRKVDPFKPEFDSSPTSTPTPPASMSSSSFTNQSNPNVQTPNHSVPNSSSNSILAATFQRQPAQHPQQHQQLHQLQQSKSVQLANATQSHFGPASSVAANRQHMMHQQQQQHGPNANSMVQHAPMQQQAQQQQQKFVGQHIQPPQPHQMPQPPSTGAQSKKKGANSQVHAVKSKGQAKGSKQAGSKSKQQQQQQQTQQPLQQVLPPAQLTQDHISHPHMDQQTLQMQQQQQGAPSAQSVPPQAAGYNAGSMMQQQPQQISPQVQIQQQQQHPQMVNNQLHSPTHYRPPPSPAMGPQQPHPQQMGGMGKMVGQQGGQQQLHPQVPQQQGQPRQVYLTLQQQQQMQFVNGQPQFVRQQFITRPPQANAAMLAQQQQQVQQQQQASPQQHPQMVGPGTPHGAIPPASPAPVPQMYRHPNQFQQMQQQQQRQMTPMQQQQYALQQQQQQQGQMPPQQAGPQQQVYMNQAHPQVSMAPGQVMQQRMALQQQTPQQQAQQVQPQPGQQQMGQQAVAVQQQQAMMNQNQYNQQMQIAAHPQEVPVQGASMSPGNVVPPQYQQQQPQPQPGQQMQQQGPRMSLNMIRMANLTPEQQQQLMQQQKMQQQQQAGSYMSNMPQQQPPMSPMGQQQLIRPVGPPTPGAVRSPQTPPQLMSPNGTPVPQRMMMRPAMHPQQVQQQMYQQQQQQMNMDPSKVGTGPQQVVQQPQQVTVRAPMQMSPGAAGQPGQQPQQQFVPQQQQQQIQFIRQRWPGPPNEQQQQFGPGGKPHAQYVHMAGPGGVPVRQMVPGQQQAIMQGPPPHLTPQQQQMWLQQQQARQRFILQQQQQQGARMARMPMVNGPTQSPMHPSMGGMEPMAPQHDPSKVRMMNTTTTTGNTNSASTEQQQLVSTSITAVVGGGVDTVIANPMASQPLTNQQQMHIVQHQQAQQQMMQGNAVGNQQQQQQQQIVVNSEQVNTKPMQQQQQAQTHPQVTGTKTILVTTAQGVHQQHQQNMLVHHQTSQGPGPAAVASGAPAQQQQGQQYQVSIVASQVATTTMSAAGSNNSSSSSSSASTPTSTTGGGSVVNEKTKTALANLLNNRLNQQQQSVQQQAQQSPTATPNAGQMVMRAEQTVSGGMGVVAGKPMQGASMVAQQQQQQVQQPQLQSGGKPQVMVQGQGPMGGVRPQGAPVMAAGSSGALAPTAGGTAPATAATPVANSMTQQQGAPSPAVAAAAAQSADMSSSPVVASHGGEMASHVGAVHHPHGAVPLPAPSPQQPQPVPSQLAPGPNGGHPLVSPFGTGHPAQAPFPHPHPGQSPQVPPPMMNGSASAQLAHMSAVHSGAAGTGAPPSPMLGPGMRPGGVLPPGHPMAAVAHPHFGGPQAATHPAPHGMAPQVHHPGQQQHPLHAHPLMHPQQVQPPTLPPQGPQPAPGVVVPVPGHPPQGIVQQAPPPGTPVAPPMPTIIQIRFFGHESRQMIPPEFCLIGCVFFIAPSYTENPSVAPLIAGWKRRIEQYGGQVVDEYVTGEEPNRITHIVTEHMQGPLQKLALSENKRCVSVFWLDDVLCNKRLLPPWRFYHLPVAYATNQNRPCRNHIISISNFEGEEREKLRQLILRTGAKYTNYLTSKNTILICKRLEGKKYEKALQWRIAIVNLYWLQDILFGHLDALQLSGLPKKYQQFEQYQNATSSMTSGAQQNMTPSQMLQRDIFRVDYSMVHSLMSPWRFPIKYDQEELAERMKKASDEKRRLEELKKAEAEREIATTNAAVSDEPKPSETAVEYVVKDSNQPSEKSPDKLMEVEQDSTNSTSPSNETTTQTEEESSSTDKTDSSGAATKRSFDEMMTVEEANDANAGDGTTAVPGANVEGEVSSEANKDRQLSDSTEPSSKRPKLDTDQQQATCSQQQEGASCESNETTGPSNVPSTDAVQNMVSDQSTTNDEVQQPQQPQQENPSESMDVDEPSAKAELSSAVEEIKKEIEEQTTPTAAVSLADGVEPMPAPTSTETTGQNSEVIPEKMEVESEIVAVEPPKTAESTCEEMIVEVNVTNNNNPQQSTDPGSHQVEELQQQPEAATVTNGDSGGMDSCDKATIPVVVTELTENSTDECNSVQFKVPLPNVPATTTTTATTAAPQPVKLEVAVLFTKIDAKTRDELRSVVESLGGKVVSDPETCTHLIADRIVPTVKYLCAFARARHVCHSGWLRECGRVGAFVDESEYHLADRYSEQLYEVDMAYALANRSELLLTDTVFMLTRSCVPSPPIIAQIIEANGGAAVLYKPPSKRQLAAMAARGVQFVVVTCDDDLHTCDYFFENKIRVVHAEFIIKAVLRQKLEYDAYSYRSPKENFAPSAVPPHPPPPALLAAPAKASAITAAAATPISSTTSSITPTSHQNGVMLHPVASMNH